jgi:hypothetical protein
MGLPGPQPTPGRSSPKRKMKDLCRLHRLFYKQLRADLVYPPPDSVSSEFTKISVDYTGSHIKQKKETYFEDVLLRVIRCGVFRGNCFSLTKSWKDPLPGLWVFHNGYYPGKGAQLNDSVRYFIP